MIQTGVRSYRDKVYKTTFLNFLLGVCVCSRMCTYVPTHACLCDISVYVTAPKCIDRDQKLVLYVFFHCSMPFKRLICACDIYTCLFEAHAHERSCVHVNIHVHRV